MTVIYIINKSSSVPLEGDIPQRVWSGKEVSYRHPRVFGCLAYVHVVKDQRGKLNPKSRPCLFLNYGEDEFNYWLWDLIDKKVIRSRDIVFMDEKKIVDWEMENKPSTTNSNRVDDKPNQTPIDPIKVGYELVGRVDSRQSWGPIEEHWESVDMRFPTNTQGEPIGRRQVAKRGSESDSTKEIK